MENVDRYRTCPMCGMIDGNVDKEYLQKEYDRTTLSSQKLYDKYPDQLITKSIFSAIQFWCPKCDYRWFWTIYDKSNVNCGVALA